METTPHYPRHLAEGLILDELFDLSLYLKLREISGEEHQETLNELISVEQRHFAFWRQFFQIDIETLDFSRRMKLRFIVLVCRLIGPLAVDLVLEAIEIYGVRKYLALWTRFQNEAVGEALRGILEDEFKHEDQIVSRLKEHRLNPDRVRNIFLGANDGLVEILGAVSGFFAGFGQNLFVLVAGLTTAVAGSLSMAAGAYVASSSENEVRRTQAEKNLFWGHQNDSSWVSESALSSATIVGVSYFIGASVPLLPVLLGAQSALPSILMGGCTVLLVSAILAFLSGMEVRRRTLTNLIIIAAAVGITYTIGILVRFLWGLEV